MESEVTTKSKYCQKASIPMLIARFLLIVKLCD